MSERRTFLVQRYSTCNWPLVRGDAPFLATGPWFSTWAYGLERFGEWRFRGDFQKSFEDYEATTDPRYYAAYALLHTGLVQALWADHSRVPQEERWMKSVEQLASELPGGPIAESVVLYLSSLSAPGHFRSYVSEDGIELLVQEVPKVDE